MTIKDWQIAKDTDENGLKKVYQLGNFPGIFRDSTNKMLDMRPKDTCPCYANLQRQSMSDLVDFVIRALENQIHILENQSESRGGPGASMGAKVESDYILELKRALDTYRGSKGRLVNEWTSAKQSRVNKYVRKL